MPFTDKPQVFNAKIREFTFGTDGRELKLGGYNTYPLYTFDAAPANPPRIGMIISDQGYDASVPGFKAFYGDCADVPAMAKKAASLPGVDFVCLELEGGDPNGANRPSEELAALAKEVYEAIDKPLAVMGCKNIEKDTELFQKVAEALQGKRILLLSCREEDYKTVAASAVMAYSQTVGAESAVDINLAKQLNVLLSQMGTPNDATVMNLGSAAAGYGFEYLASTIERVKGAALTQNDEALQMPVITPVGDDAWSVKEALLEEADAPEWGSREERGIAMEIETAAAVLGSGSDAILLKHPESVKTLAEMISALM